VGQTNKRVGKDGKVRYTAVYTDVRGKRRSAGTYDSKKVADKEWQKAEARASEGRPAPVRRGAIRFKPYVEEQWFPNHRLELRSRENYGYYLDAHIIPYFESMRLIDIRQQEIREFVTNLEKDEVPASSIEYCLTILSAIFTTALSDQIVFFHPCRGVTGPVVPKKVRQIVTPEQFDTLYSELEEERWQLLVETDVETGLRWGELTELRPKDLSSCVFTVSRVVVELTSKFHPEGGRFLVKDYPKDDEHRQVTISKQLDEKLWDFIERNGIGPEDLIFAMEQPSGKRDELMAVPDPDKLGRKEVMLPSGKTTSYKHGSKSCYVAGKCRCDDCKAAFAIYRRGRRLEGKDRKGKGPRRAVTTDPDRHIPRSWFRANVWLPARDAAKLPAGVKVHSLRHAHASWLLAGGADIARVKASGAPLR
jgi:integrase